MGRAARRSEDLADDEDKCSRFSLGFGDRPPAPFTTVLQPRVEEALMLCESYQGNSLLISWMKRPLGLSDPSSATATVVFAPSGTDIGAALEPRAGLDPTRMHGVRLAGDGSRAIWVQVCTLEPLN